jgi:hypothetical protein
MKFVAKILRNTQIIVAVVSGLVVTIRAPKNGGQQERLICP